MEGGTNQDVAGFAQRTQDPTMQRLLYKEDNEHSGEVNSVGRMPLKRAADDVVR